MTSSVSISMVSSVVDKTKRASETVEGKLSPEQAFVTI